MSRLGRPTAPNKLLVSLLRRTGVRVIRAVRLVAVAPSVRLGTAGARLVRFADVVLVVEAVEESVVRVFAARVLVHLVLLFAISRAVAPPALAALVRCFTRIDAVGAAASDERD